MVISFFRLGNPLQFNLDSSRFRSHKTVFNLRKIALLSCDTTSIRRDFEVKHSLGKMKVSERFFTVLPRHILKLHRFWHLDFCPLQSVFCNVSRFFPFILQRLDGKIAACRPSFYAKRMMCLNLNFATKFGSNFCSA